LREGSGVDGSVEVVQFRSTVRNDSRREIYSRGRGLASTAGCAHLYTCPFWISVRLYLRGKSSDKQNGVFPRENETKVNYNKLDYKIIQKIPGWLIVR